MMADIDRELMLALWRETKPSEASPYALYGNPPMWETVRAGPYTLYSRPGKTMTRDRMGSYVEVDGVHFQWKTEGRWVDQGRQCTFDEFIQAVRDDLRRFEEKQGSDLELAVLFPSPSQSMGLS